MADKSTVKVTYLGDATSLNRASKQAAGAMSKVQKVALAGAAAGAVAGAALIKFGKSSVNAFESAAKEASGLQRQFGGTAESASRLAFAANRTGVGVDTLATGLRTFSKALSNTAQKTKTVTTITRVATGAWKKQTTILRDAAGHFHKVSQMVPITKMVKFATAVKVANPVLSKLGFNVRDVHGKLLPMSALLPKVADLFEKMPNGPEKTALAMKLFGKAGAQLLPFLNKGAAGIEELNKQSDKLGLTMSGKDLAAVKANAAAHKDFSAAVQGLEVSVGRGLFPIMARFSTFLATQGVPAVTGLSHILTKTLKPALSWIGGVIDAALPKIASFIKGFQGKLDGTKYAKYGSSAKKAFLDIRKAVVEQVVPAFESFLKAAESLGSTIGSAVTPPLVALGKALLDNARFIVPLTVGLVAIKGVMLAYQGVTTAVTTATEIWESVTKAAAVVQRFFMVTTIEATGAQRASTLSMIRARVVSAYQTAQIYALIVAQKIQTAAQWAMNAAMDANPIALVVIAIAALAAGLIYTYKHSETFRKIVQGAFAGIASAASHMWEDVIRPVFKFIVDSWFTVVGALVHGAASAFGWVPKIGPGLKSAAKEFDKFKNSVNASLDGIKDKTVKVNLDVSNGQNSLRTAETAAGVPNSSSPAPTIVPGAGRVGQADSRSGDVYNIVVNGSRDPNAGETVTRSLRNRAFVAGVA